MIWGVINPFPLSVSVSSAVKTHSGSLFSMVALRGARNESWKRGMVGVFDAVGFYALFL
jgi:hypothetical protein